MTEPTDRDREMARVACRNWARDGAFIWSEVAKQIAAARDEGRREATQWQPIETAPKDKFVLIYDPDLRRLAMAKWQGRGWYGIDDCGLTYDLDHPEPTHWLPLPEIPQ